MLQTDILSLLPMLLLAGGILLTMLLVALRRNHTVTLALTLVVLTISFLSILCTKIEMPHAIGELFLIDHFGRYYQALILLAAFVVTVFSYISLQTFFPGKRKEEYYLLLMLATLGASMIVISTHFISFFVSLELLTVSLYTLISYYRERNTAIEAGLKYLMLAAMSSSFLLFGMALIYAVSGTMSFHALATSTLSLESNSLLILVAGIGMMVVGIGFKLAVVPFHMWTPDVYQGASSPVSAFIASVSKGAMVAVLIRFFIMADLYRFEKITMVFTVISILSMLIGNLLALLQNNIKRMLAYSSIAHFGYLLVALIAGKEIGVQAATFYITAYIITILGAFGMVTMLSTSDAEATSMKDYQALFWRKPFLAFLFTLILLSLAGIPLTAGFMAKFFLLTAGVGNANWLLVVTLVMGSVIGLYYYSRVIVSMMKPAETSLPEARLSLVCSTAGVVTITLLGILIIELGIYPVWLVDLFNGLMLFSN